MKKLFLALLLLVTPAVAIDYPGWPNGATPVFVVSANSANAQNVVTMPAVVGRTNFLTGARCTSNGATAASYITATITGLMGGTRNVVIFVGINTSGGNDIAIATSEAVAVQPIPATAANTAIVLTVPAMGTGNTLSYCTLTGFHTRPPV